MSLPVTEAVVFFVPNGSGAVDILTVDACLTEQHSMSNTLTDHPVEQGFNITDHSRPDPRKATLDCVVTNTPIAGALPGANYAAGMWQRLVELHNSPQLIDVHTVRDAYYSVSIENVSSAVDVKSANALRFSVAIKEIRVVQNKFTRVVFAKSPKAHPKKKAGAGATKPADGTADGSLLTQNQTIATALSP